MRLKHNECIELRVGKFMKQPHIHYRNSSIDFIHSTIRTIHIYIYINKLVIHVYVVTTDYPVKVLNVDLTWKT